MTLFLCGGGLTCGSFCVGGSCTLDGRGGGLGEEPADPSLPACGWVRKTRLLAPELQTSPPPDSRPAPIPESAPWPAPPAPGQARPVRPLEVEKLIAVSVWGRRGAAELRKTPLPPANHSSPSPRPQPVRPPTSAGGVRDACVWGGRVMQRMRAVAGTLAAVGKRETRLWLSLPEPHTVW